MMNTNQKMIMNCMSYINREGIDVSGLVISKEDWSNLKSELGSRCEYIGNVISLDTANGKIQILHD